jgi:hypothetical protein
MLTQSGGPSHIDIYDLKPDAPAEIRGEFKPIQTKVPGIDICELLPMQAKLADKFTVVRNVQMVGQNHDYFESVSGFQPTPAEFNARRTNRPAFGSVLSALRQGPQDLPTYVSLRGGRDEDPSYLGFAHRPFLPTGEGLKNLKLHSSLTPERLADRRELLRSFDQLRRDVDRKSDLTGMDAFQGRAFDLITSNKAYDAFDADNKEPVKVREKYGQWTTLLQALRLAEAGVSLVTVEAPSMGPLGQRPWWDTHEHNFVGLRHSLPNLDRGVSALLSDISDRGLEKDVVVLMWGEFGRTPGINKSAGRDHWPHANYAWFAGGGLRMGQVIGATDARAARPKGPSYSPQNVIATLYHVLGIDPQTTLPDQSGRPVYLLDDPRPIAELV